MKAVVEKGKTLDQALRKLGVELDRPCGGNGTCGGCMVEVEKFGKVKACQFRLPGCYEVQLPAPRKFTAVGAAEEDLFVPEDIREVPGWRKSLSIAVDIGTTTVVLWGTFGNRECRRSFTNPQRCFGADVMSRIESAQRGHGEEMRKQIRKALEEEIAFLAGELAPEEHSARIVIAANETMIHLLCGWDCEGLGKAPFVPVSLELQRQHWDIALSDGKELACEINILPGLSAFIGGDIVSGIYACRMWEQKTPALLLDLGTNGEMALFADGRFYTASAAAGPAFEGSALAMKIHGAGIVKELSRLLLTGQMDETGLLISPEIALSGDAVITQDDVREIQMAKAAIYAGIRILLAKAKLDEDAVDIVYLAGGMGYYIDPSEAATIGLLPKAFVTKTKAVGNLSLIGAHRFLMEDFNIVTEELEQIRQETTEIVLANEPEFMELYIKYMNFMTG
jgi:uncharacterized 2Fe-2S/4Fe-4S cluster protein (DUF4445 family)